MEKTAKIEYQLIGNSLFELIAISRKYSIQGNRYLFYGNEIQNFLNTEADSSELIINRDTEVVDLIKLIFPMDMKEGVKKQLPEQAQLMEYFEISPTKSFFIESNPIPMFVEQWELDSETLMNITDINSTFFQMEIFSSVIA